MQRKSDKDQDKDKNPSQPDLSADQQPEAQVPADETAPEALSQQEPLVEEPQEAPPMGDDVMAMLSELLQRDPMLAWKVADVIEQHYGGVTMDNYGDFGDLGAGQAVAGTPQAATPMPASPQPQAAPAVPNEFVDRLNNLEQSHASLALDRELADAKQEYDALKQQLPILPELDDNELLQIALDRGGLPLKDALALWAVQKMREGEGTIADRVVAAVMQKGAAKGLPAVEGKGGTAPSGEAPPPESMKDARRLAKDRLKAMFASSPGA